MTEFRMLHTMIRVQDLDKSIDFYCRHLGMKLLHRTDFPEGKFTLAFVGYGDEENNTVLELTHNWDREELYDLGDGFGHLALGVKDIYGVCAALEKQGVEIPRKPGPMKHGKTEIAFIRDPDGYMIELIQK
ncbi:lactoylglutathione lyase [Emcibacter sp.]|uniref:lactoylglutathione lyase n=1 Tax=Emcibacter sp. TaxID=1979954 RepID=UPI002AA6E10D|nr:lactoylglutathione lyase [Emcibacter sp.]